MNISRKFKLLLISVSALLLFAGCDLFVLGPSLNQNYDDEEVGFGRLGAALVDDEEVRVGWDWFDLERDLRGIDPVYDKIIIQHSTGSYPVSRLGGKLFEISDWDPVTNPLWSTVFKDLKNDREHYFALYAHEKNGRWMAPIYTSVYLEGYDKYTVGGLLTRNDGVNVPVEANLSTGVYNNLTSGLRIINDNTVNIFYYDVWEDEKVASAELNLIINSVTVDDVLLVQPIRIYWDSGDASQLNLWGDDSFVFDRSVTEAYNIAAGNTGSHSFDITDVFAKSQLHRTNGIVLYTGGSNITMDYNTDFPTIDLQVVRKW